MFHSKQNHQPANQRLFPLISIVSLYYVAFLWGISEATFFFIVPDLFLSLICIRYNAYQAICFSLLTLAGALVGGVLLYYLGRAYPEIIYNLLERLPAINTDMMQEVREKTQYGLSSLVVGSFTGVPYKLYSYEAGQQSINLVQFVLISIPARLFRWALVIVFCQFVLFYLQKIFSQSQIIKIFFGFWFVFYGAFFSLMPG
ncbi:VTT domain-containing protein [Kiloniella sp. EL199]|uniref:VTT domain-containing protein n=1 Tax=Kiloniella sp. EL199 TaxID=2107581 RepID=UPI000EA3F069|nr:VTT domain-containing protein [Kiloniella sp. EL199]